MDTKLLNIDDISSSPQENLSTDKLKTLLEIFCFNIPEEQLQYIKINSLTKWRLQFTNTFTKETCSGYYTNESPEFDEAPYNTAEPERFLAQKIQSNSVIKMNWFYVQGDRYIMDEYSLEPTYIPPYRRNKVSVIEEAIFNEKTTDGDFVLHIQKELPYFNEQKNFIIEIFKGTFDKVYPRQLKDVLEPDYSREILNIQYDVNKDIIIFRLVLDVLDSQVKLGIYMEEICQP